MESIFLGLAVLACPVGMGLMMWFMAKGMGGKKEDPATVEQMRAEQQRLATQVEQLERERSADEVPAH
ncbi:MAG: DUF2933 domain-containing protein [Solirubrobacterales bacterium]|nr:DUF2933 domain-containing protein [Solirubrobacterales bacterium]